MKKLFLSSQEFKGKLNHEAMGGVPNEIRKSDFESLYHNNDKFEVFTSEGIMKFLKAINDDGDSFNKSEGAEVETISDEAKELLKGELAGLTHFSVYDDKDDTKEQDFWVRSKAQ